MPDCEHLLDARHTDIKSESGDNSTVVKVNLAGEETKDNLTRRNDSVLDGDILSRLPSADAEDLKASGRASSLPHDSTPFLANQEVAG